MWRSCVAVPFGTRSGREFTDIPIGTLVVALCTVKDVYSGSSEMVGFGLVTTDVLVLYQGRLCWIMGEWLRAETHAG